MLIVGIFLAAFCFSTLVEAVQTLIHIDHQDTMHHPVAVFALAVGGLILNIFCILLIGGYTYHQGSFLHITSSGDVILDRVVSGKGLCRGSRRLSKTKRDENSTITTQSNTSIQLDVANVTSKTPQKNIHRAQSRHKYNEAMRDISSKHYF